jgi:hypothetical protein
MGDLNDINSAQSVKIIGSNSSGLETYPVDSIIVSPTSTAPGLITRPLSYEPATYSAGITSLSAAGAATDIFTITGSATKTIRVLKITVSATKTSETIVPLLILKRSTANTGGTSSTLDNVPRDSQDAAATAVVRAYTANPTLGTLVGNVKATKIVFVENTKSTNSNYRLEFCFTSEQEKPVVLRGVGEVLALNLGATTVAGSNINIDITWTEE